MTEDAILDANARFIAAAPRMFEVLEMLVQWNDDAGDAPEMLSDCMEEAREVLEGLK